MLKDLVLKNRSYRRFKQSEAVSMDTLRELVDLARNSPSATNRQALKFILSAEAEKNAKIFETLGWAGALPDWPGPAEGERPAAYIIVLLDTEIAKNAGCDHGIAAQSILLGATEKGLGGCMLGSAKREVLTKNLDIDPRYEIQLVIALGVPAETVVLEVLEEGQPFKYWRDEKTVHHVPKRKLDDIII